MTDASGDEADYVRSMVERLWPAGAVELRTQPPAHRRPPGALDLVVLPSLDRPRLLIPRGGRAAAAALRGYRTSATSRSRLKLRVVAGLASLGAARLLPHVVRVTPPDGEALVGIDAYLGGILGQPVVASIHIGPARAVRKPVLQLIAPSGDTVAFAKLGTNPLTDRLVVGEAERLGRIDRTRLRHVRAPELLHHGRWHDVAVLVQQALTVDRPEPITPAMLRPAMLEVSALEGTSTSTLRDHPYLDRLRDRLAAVPPDGSTPLLAETLTEVVAYAGDVPLVFGSWHGDWSPWNMAAQAGRLSLWDWEHFETGVPAGYDALHCRVHSAVKEGTDATTAYAVAQRELADLLGPFQESAQAQAVTALLYAVDIALRYLADREAEGGTVLGDVATWLAPVLRVQRAALGEAAHR